MFLQISQVQRRVKGSIPVIWHGISKYLHVNWKMWNMILVDLDMQWRQTYKGLIGNTLYGP